jgi:predicted nucleic acid binding AN1-type Zn finger protein
MKCYLCEGEDFVFKCNYCKQYFCSEHRLPVNHVCPAIDQYLEKRKKVQSLTITSLTIISLIILRKLSIYISLKQK